MPNIIREASPMNSSGEASFLDIDEFRKELMRHNYELGITKPSIKSMPTGNVFRNSHNEKGVGDSYFSNLNSVEPSINFGRAMTGKATNSVIATDKEIKKSKHNMFRFRMKRESVNKKIAAASEVAGARHRLSKSQSQIRIDITTQTNIMI